MVNISIILYKKLKQLNVPNAPCWAHFYYSKLINRLPASENFAVFGLVCVYFN